MINIAKGYLFVIENLKTKISNGNFQPSGFDIIEKFTSGDFWQKDQKKIESL